MSDDKFKAVLIGIPSLFLLALIGRTEDQWPTHEQMVQSLVKLGYVGLVGLGLLLIGVFYAIKGR